MSPHRFTFVRFAIKSIFLPWISNIRWFSIYFAIFLDFAQPTAFWEHYRSFGFSDDIFRYIFIYATSYFMVFDILYSNYHFNTILSSAVAVFLALIYGGCSLARVVVTPCISPSYLNAKKKVFPPPLYPRSLFLFPAWNQPHSEWRECLKSLTSLYDFILFCFKN